MTIALALTLLTLSCFVGPPEDTQASPVGIEFSASIPKHQRGPLQASFTKTLPLACPNLRPCTDSCSDGEATVGLQLSGKSRDYVLHWVANDPRLEAPIVVDSRCELCSLVELEEQLAAELSRLCARLDAITAAAQLELSSDPSGARVRIDGLEVGRTPWSGELVAGEHSVEVRRLGRQPQRRTLMIDGMIDGGRVHEHIHLPRWWAGASFDGGRQARRPTWPAWTSLGLGLTMTVAGTALIALHEQGAGSCSGPDVDAQGNCRFRFRSRPLGVGLAALGAGALAGGVGLMVWAQRGPSQSCAGITISGRF